MEGGKGACVYVRTSRGNTAGQSQICFLRACTSALLLLIYNNQTLTIEGVHATSTGRQFLHISAYFRICAAILRGNEWGKCTVRPILQARFEVRSMHLASTLEYTCMPYIIWQRKATQFMCPGLDSWPFLLLLQ